MEVSVYIISARICPRGLMMDVSATIYRTCIREVVIRAAQAHLEQGVA